MAEQIPYNVAASLINKLASLAFREIGRIYRVMDELKRLHQTVESITAVLLDAEKKQEHDKAVQLWITRFKDLLLAADDLFDDIATEELLRQLRDDKKSTKVRRFFSSSNPIRFCRRRQLANEIEKIRKKFNDVAEDMSKLNLNPTTIVVNQTGERVWREESSFVLESDIIGREESKREILSLLRELRVDQNVSLVVVVGIGGLGKTALAQLVYTYEKEQNYFEKFMWVCVSDDFDVKTVVRKILESLTDTKSDEQESFDNLQNKLRANLNGKKYLLVLDDIWNESHEKWTQLRTYLMCGAQGSKILVTTRSQAVAEAMGVNTPFVLKGLTIEQSWSLMKNIAFRDDTQGVNHSLESIGKEIAERCKGVPLAIRALAGILHGKDKESEWIEVLEGDFWKHDEAGNNTNIMSVLKLSYQNLSPKLKQCFAYCSIYPKDWNIKKNELIQLWMAQGYLECSNEKQCMEDVGNQFVKMLLMKSFFQDVKFDDHGDIYRFKMHDLMHDLALLVASKDCYLDCEQQNVEKPMYVSLEHDTIHLADSIDGSRLRTFFLRPHVELLPLEGRQSTIFSFKRLRVLRISSTLITNLPNSIKYLKHLRYLDLSECHDLSSLPKSIGNLVNLQTLKLNYCGNLDRISAQVVTKLINLRHLEIVRCKAFEEMMPVGLGKLSSLQSLSKFVVGDGKEAAKLNELKDLNSLRGKLEIYRLRNVREVRSESQEVNLKEKKNLDSLSLSFGIGGMDDNDCLQLLDNLQPHQHLKRLAVWCYPGVKFSNWISSLTNVSHISLSGFNNCRDLPPLEHLPSLKTLEVSDMEVLEHIYMKEVSPTEEGTFFPSLESLSFYGCRKIGGWKKMGEDDASVPLPPFPRLSRLFIHNCPMLSCMPTFPHLDEELELIDSDLKPLIETLNRVSTSSFTPLSLLKSLKISGSVLHGMRDLPSQLLRNFTSLAHLQVWLFEGFESWFVDLLPSLQTFEVSKCGIQALPNEICNLLSLQRINIFGCHNLASLPEGMPRLTNLHTLEIKECPHLLERCKRDAGADWTKIAHVPNIILKERW